MTLRQHIRDIGESMATLQRTEVKRDRESLECQLCHIILRKLELVDNALERNNINPDLSR